MTCMHRSALYGPCSLCDNPKRGVYVAAPYTEAANVRGFHRVLRALGGHPMSTWAEKAEGPEDLRAIDPASKIRIRGENYARLAASDVLLLWDPDYIGHETYIECAFAMSLHKPIIKAGPHERVPLSMDVYDRLFRTPDAASGIRLALSLAL